MGVDFEVLDKLFDEKKIEELHAELTPHSEEKNVDIQWRFARASKDLAEKNQSDKKKYEEYMRMGLKAAETALEADPNSSYSHKWMGIMLGKVSAIDGTKQQLIISPKIKEHLEKSIEINENDPTTIYCLGVWHFEFADLGTMTRKLASTLLAAVPESDYETALKWFEKAEQVQPDFYIDNTFMIGKCYAKLKKVDEAKPFLDKVIESADATETVKAEAKKLAKAKSGWF